MKAFLWYLLFLVIGVYGKPNIIILLADDLGIGDVGCFGNDSINTPNIDSIAHYGVKLTHHLTAAAVCTPSRAALLTGRYPVRSGMESSGRNKVFFFVAASGGLPQNETTIAKALKEHGYSTAIFGKWHLGGNCDDTGDSCHHPLKHGFDRFYGLPLSNFKDFGEGESVITAYAPNFYQYLTAFAVSGLTISFFIFKTKKTLTVLILFIMVVLPAILSTFLLNLKTLNGVVMRNQVVVEQPLKLQGLTQRFVQEANEFIASNVIRDRPFFLYVPFVHVHTALFTMPEFRGNSRFGRYGDNIEELDWAVGEIISALNKHNIFNNTFLYFSSDNGGHVEEVGRDGEREGGYNGIFRGGKMIAGFEGGVRVPSLISWPSVIKGKTELNVPTSQMDIFSTIMDVASAPQPTDRIIDGKSILPLLQGKETKSPHKVLFHYCGIRIHAATYIPDGGKNKVWKIHWTTPAFPPGKSNCGYVCHCFGKFVIHHDPPLLFELSSDPSESHALNITDNIKYTEIISRVNSLRKKHRETLEKVPDQFSFWNTVWKPWLQPCCNFPRCSCRDLKYSDI